MGSSLFPVPMKDFVLSRAMAPLMIVAEKHGLDEAVLVEGLSFDHAACRDSPNLKLPWREFASYMRRLHDAVGDQLYEDVKEVVGNPGGFAMFYRIGGLFCTPRTYFKMANHFFAPMVFPMMELEVIDGGPKGCRMVASLGPELDDSDEFFEISRALMEVGPVVLGMEPAQIRMKRQERRAEFEVVYPQSRSLAARARHMLDVARSADLFMEELTRQNETLMESYEALQSSESSFRRLVEESPEGMVVYDGTRIVFANDALARLIGLERGEELRGRLIDSLTRDAGELEAILSREKQAGEKQQVRARVVALAHASGAFVSAEASTFATVFNRQRVCISIIRDVTMRNEVMARAVDMDRLITMGTLAAGVAHEINNPVTIVQANVSFIADFLEDLLASKPECVDAEEARELREALAASERALDRAQEITGELKTIGRGHSEKLEIVDPRQAIDASMQWIRSVLKERARIVTELAPCGEVRSNLPRIGQVVLNVLLNAAHAIEPGDPEANEVRITTCRDGDFAVIEISDTGEGIAPEYLDRIFDPFFTTKPAGVGTGLGLFVSRSIMERLGGSLTIESILGEGTCARIALPLYRE